MAKTAKPGDAGNGGVTNLTATREVVNEEVRRILGFKTQRADINAKINASRKRVQSYGIPPAALDLAIRMKEADPEKRQAMDEGYAIARDAMGLGLQRSLFEQLDERLDGEKVAADAKSEKAPKAAPKGPDGDTDLTDAADNVTPISRSLAAAREHLGTADASLVPDAVA